MGKLENFRGFSDKFKEKLNLTQAQVSQIEETEYNFHRDYFWNKLSDNEHSESAYLIKILNHLTNEQRAVYNSFVETEKSKKKKRNKEIFDKTLEAESIRLKCLNLTNTQLEQYVKKKLSFTELRLKKMKQAKTPAEMEFDLLQQKVYEEEIFPIFDANQLKGYRAIKKVEELKREEEGKKWRIKREKDIFKQRYNIDLNEEQAKELFSKDFSHRLKDSNGEYFSDFEMKEKELNWYENHLTKEQFKVYLPFYEEQIKFTIEAIKKSNAENDKLKLLRTKCYFEYYLDNVLPHVVEARKRIETKLTDKQKKLIEEIRNYYFIQQDTYRDEYVNQHKRHYKEFKPNALRNFRLRQKIEKFNVSIGYLYEYGPTKELMTREVQLIVDEENIKLRKVYSDLKDFQIERYESTGGNYGVGWVTKIPMKNGEEHLEKIGILLLYPCLKKNLDLIGVL